LLLWASAPLIASAVLSSFSLHVLAQLFGAGLLALPNVLGQVGLILGVIIYIIVSLLCSLSCYYLLEAREVTEHYLLFDPARPGDYKPAYDGQNQTDQAKTAAASKPHHLVTYGDLADVLLGHTMASITRWTIIILNILFTAGLVIVICENLSDLAQDEQGAMAARRAVGLCLLPAVAAFLQIPWLQDMWIISLVGLAVYTIGVIGSTLYSAILTISGEENGRGVPDGLWDVHWGGVTTFVGSAVYAMEGINLALPTVHR
jgi:amino acid permease